MKGKYLLFLSWIVCWVLCSRVVHAQSNLVLLVSQPGDYIGQGQTYETTNLNDFSVNNRLLGSRPYLEATAFGFIMDFAAPGSSNLVVGVYSNATRFPFNGSGSGLSVFGNGRACNSVCGNFTVRELATDGSGNITHLWLTFTQHCECSMAPMTGDIRYHSLLAPTTPPAQTLLVPSQYPTIQAAIDAASTFTVDTVLVAPGIYNESVQFNGKSVVLTSEGGPAQTFLTAPGATAVSLNGGVGTNAVLSGFTITNSGTGVGVGGAPTIVSNVIVNCGTGIDCGSGSCTIRGNMITGCSGAAVSLSFTGSPLIEGNLLQGNGGGIGMWEAGSPTIRNNMICLNHGDGVSMVNYSDANIIQNVIVDNGGDGIYGLVIQGARGPWIVNNTIAGNGGAGFNDDAYGNNDIEVINNIIVGDPALAGEVGDFQFNDFYPADSSSSNLVGSAGNISADPLFACPPSEDYRVVRGSPGIDAGTNGTPLLPTTDFTGGPRVLSGIGTGPAIVDIGAYEFNPTNPVTACPIITCPDVQTVECGAPATVTVEVGEPDGGALAVVWGLNGTLVQTNYIPAGPAPTMTNTSFTADLPVGTNLVEIAAANSWSNTAYCSTTVTVVDTTPPVIQSASAVPNILWPPNHKLVTVAINAVVTDNCGPATWKIISVQSNEPVNGRGDGNTSPDWQILGDHSVALRAGRSGNGSGRIYTITLQAEDNAGNLSTPTIVTVTVPKSMGK